MTDEEVQQILKELAGCYGRESMPKYIVLGDGAVYFYKKEEDRYALCDQTPSVQEGIPTTEGPR
jgi:hypothetical protein